MKIFHFFRELIFPNSCGICGSMLVSGEEAYFGLCEPCRQKLEFSHDERCTVCGKPLISEIDICMHCRKPDNEARFVDSTIALYPYGGIYRQILSAYKFQQHKQLAHFFAAKLIEAGMKLETKHAAPLVWVPVPPRPGKIRQKGWDQIDYLAGTLEKEKTGGKISVSKCLTRLNTRAQKTLNREERLSNLKGQIICSGKAPKHAVMFDDVVTTGATLEACAEALKKPEPNTSTRHVCFTVEYVPKQARKSCIVKQTKTV